MVDLRYLLDSTFSALGMHLVHFNYQEYIDFRIKGDSKYLRFSHHDHLVIQGCQLCTELHLSTQAHKLNVHCPYLDTSLQYMLQILL